MSRRKSCFPARFSLPSHLGYSKDITLISEKSPKTKQVSFDFDVYNNCEFSVKIKQKKVFKEFPKNSLILGEIALPVDEVEKIEIDLKEAEFTLLVKDTKEFLQLVLKLSRSSGDDQHVNLTINDTTLLKSINDLLQHKYAWVINDVESLYNGIFNVAITIAKQKMPIYKAKNLVELLFNKTSSLSACEDSSFKKTLINEFFREVQNFQKNDLSLSDKNVQHEKLLPKLRPYQVKAVQWMILRECNDLQEQNYDWLTSVIEIFKTKCNQLIYYNKISGILSLDTIKFPVLPKGGILADEMGLGKTVVVMSLILNNPLDYNPDIDEYNVLLAHSQQEAQSKIVCHTKEFMDNHYDLVSKNKETCLDGHEKLLCSEAKKGKALKRALTEWYEYKLAEFSASPGKKKRIEETNKEDEIKCICGNLNTRKRENCIQCPECKRYQHKKCIGYNKKFIYFCPPCWSKKKLVKSGATLIIAPTSIYHQWFEEISKHIKSDTFENGVFMYDGPKNNGFIQPSVLASYDVVITTYAVLRAEINHASLNECDRKLRHEERFLKLCSPLRQVLWWRLCLDEAQMVESDHSQINQMINLISAVNRWSVTGTPIQKSVNELFYLVEWLRVEPFTEKSLWNNLLYQPYLNGNRIPLYSVISRIFWRSSKEDVANELMVPEQKIEYHFLKFSAIEQNFYMREHSVSSNEFSERLKRLGIDTNRTIDSLEKTTLTRLLGPLLNLRQACSHPMAVKGSKIHSKTGNMTLTELLQYLFNKTKVECEEGMRQHIAAINGLAGIYCILNEWPTAVQYYRNVLQFSEEYKDEIKMDSLQRIHTLTNLAEILQFHPEGIPPTLRDGSLKEDVKLLEDKYMLNATSDLESDEKLLNNLTNKVMELETKFKTESGVWWNHIINRLTIDGFLDELMDKIEAELMTNEVEDKKQVNLFLTRISSKGIEIILRNWLSDIKEGRANATQQLESLRKKSGKELVNCAIDCHLRTIAFETGKKKKCYLCQCESILQDYECALFDVSRKVLKANYEKVLDGAQTKGSWRAHKSEKCLRALLIVARTKSSVENWCIKDGKIHLQMLEAMKKEFKQIRAVWMSINHKVQALDEISMCKLRLRLRLPGEPIPPKLTNLSLREHNKTETIFIIEHHEVESQKLKLQADLELSKSDFKKKYGTLLYLRNLGQKENSKPEPCPVCNTVLENEWCVLQCGHSYCIDCIRIMLTRSPKPSLSCPVCREITKSCDLSFIDLNGKQDSSGIVVEGDHSTKVDGIIRCLLQLKRDNPKVKVLIFSTWTVVLKILEVALTQNGVSFRRMPGSKYQIHLKEFKDPSLDVTVLLLPIGWGSKGLNLIEATHVFLVEPIMNPAEELQAIGRVHRIGQTKETVVHRFLIRGTIEEKIHTAVSEAKDKWDDKKVTLEDLKNLFDIKNEYMTSENGKEISEGQ